MGHDCGNGDILLDLRGVTAGYGGDIQILHGIHLQVARGQAVGIIGPNGAGKSTLLKVAFGLLELWDGSIKFAGKAIEHLPATERVRLGIAYVPQEDSLFPQMSVEDNLTLAGWISTGGNRRALKKRLAKVYERFPAIKERSRNKVTVLSGGQRKQVEIGRALMMQPTLLLLDEPTAGLSPRVASEIYEDIRQLKGGDIGILLVEQNVRQALRTCDHLHLIDSGINRDQGPPEHFATYLNASGLGKWTATAIEGGDTA